MFSTRLCLAWISLSIIASVLVEGGLHSSKTDHKVETGRHARTRRAYASCRKNKLIARGTQKRNCTARECTLACLRNLEFPDGTDSMKLTCNNGKWDANRPGITIGRNLACEAPCSPRCLNGGLCRNSQCECPEKFRGLQCQYPKEVCDPEKLEFNGGWHCSVYGDRISCELNCAEDIEFDFQPEGPFTCIYSDGVFKPITRVPQCQIGANFQVLPAQYSWTNEIVKDQQHPLGMVNKFETKKMIVQSVQRKIPEPALCSTWGGGNYKLFDGEMFTLGSSCPHTLVDDTQNGSFTITTANSPGCSAGGACFKVIKMLVQGKEYTLSLNGEGFPEFRTLTKVLPIPAQLLGMRVGMSAHFIVVKLDDIGVTLKWDGALLVEVLASESVWDKTGGLCGNNNKNRKDDLDSEDGTNFDNIVGFAKKSLVQGNTDSCYPELEDPCSENDDLETEASNYCSELLAHHKFEKCFEDHDFDTLIIACQRDYCTCKNEEKKSCACDFMDVQMRVCAFKKIIGTNEMDWRSNEICPMKCTGGRIYMSCGPQQQASCSPNAETMKIEDGDSVEGCFCSPGSLLHNGRCISPEECPCELRGRSFNIGASRKEDCNTCTCMSGNRWDCTQKKCSARSSIVGDPHIRTFDGVYYDFMGKGSYHLVKGEDYIIEGEFAICNVWSPYIDPPSCVNSVTIRVNDTTVKLKQKLVLSVNGIDTQPPVTSEVIKVRMASSMFITAELSNGMKVWWDGSQNVYIDASVESFGLTQGLAGTFNGNQSDDLLLPNGDQADSVITFANSWKTEDSVPDVPNVKTSHPCESSRKRFEEAIEQCSKLKSEVFEECKWYLNPDPFYADCKFDMCSIEGNASLLICPALAAYATECARRGVEISWRENFEECRVQCPAGQTYQICGDSCARTCSEISSLENCVADCVEGCNCPEGYTLHTNDTCIPIVQCPCEHDGSKFEAGYRDVRAVNNDQYLYTCSGALWNHRLAKPDDIGVCSAWGDSHYITFDGKLFGFQAVCDYVLAKGSLRPREAFEVSTQNVPCGKTGVTCSKSITLVVGNGEGRETITLTRGKDLPQASFERIAIRRAGLFVFLDVADLGLVVQWDEGTRVYVRLNPKWRGHTEGLCGNYNDDVEDDFKTPSGGIIEGSDTLFGDSWKKDSSCRKSKKIGNMCLANPDRKSWANEKCGLLKSPLFQACHSEVKIAPYLERCLFDTCGCDEGGDCECMCTVLAAYAQECSARGVPMKWRSQKLCPVQCDESCTTYTPCMSTCPTESCVNIALPKNDSHSCGLDTCVEGCSPKACPAGEIYLNDSYSQCVPRATCDPNVPHPE